MRDTDDSTPARTAALEAGAAEAMVRVLPAQQVFCEWLLQAPLMADCNSVACTAAAQAMFEFVLDG